MDARPGDRPKAYRTVAVAAILVALEALAISLLYKHSFEFECRATAPAWLCELFSTGVARAMTALAVLVVLLAARPRIRHALRLRTALSTPWVCAHLAGFAAILAPWAFLADGADLATVAGAFGLWSAGLALAGAGMALALAPGERWLTAAREMGWIGGVALLLALAAPDLAQLAQLVWYWPKIADLTFSASAALLALTGQPVVANPETVELGIGEFIVLVGRQCSGVEGFALITSFLGLYFLLFRDVLRFPHALILIPIGLLLSWCFNAARIAGLIWIGAHVSPDLAMNGFHSHAGWLLFTLLSLSLAGAVHFGGWFRRRAPAQPVAAEAPPPLKPFFQDPIAAQILPFAVFMASALLASTFTQTPTVVYPLRAMAMAAALAMFWRPLRAMEWRIDWIAPALGFAIGLLWIATAPPPAETDLELVDSLSALPTALLAIWIASRVIGTTVLVPLIEEMFFRGYVMGRLNRGGLLWTVVAVVVSAGLFAALHERWLAAGLAGVCFGLLTLRSGRLSDAIVAHAAANAVIAAVAAYSGDWHLI